jgi:mono/diheme cytochrome c family protein
LVLLLLIVFAAAAGAWYLAGRGFSAREEPSRLEEAVALGLRDLATPRNVKEITNPVPATPEIVQAGLRHFADHCAICHGNDGGGDTELGRGMYPKPPDLREARTRNLSDGEIFYIIENGVRFTGMPGFGQDTAESSNETWHLVHFVRHLPKITPEELAEMERLTPKDAEELEAEREAEEFLKGGTQKPAQKPAHVHKP